MDPSIQAVGGLRIDGVGMQNQAAERRLDMPARAAKPIVEVEVAECGIEIVPPQQTDHPPAKPDAFGIAGRSVEDTLSFSEFVDLLRLFAAVRRGRARRLFRGLGVGRL